ncbi:HAD-IC family P-type ATPase [Balneolaceae bacterium YR4-1]|uniref:HAD-IC family P-type ATPase n=1 Tax=Halalkalibaculum roseum TaxID=2709311 RepID=A0A6M1T460_9BACT|nr:heavy metal translocating P-type ATPase metal-binding domain-containing protein [Halalkalibaculum roseum]NGP77537.1 HAD-IC family P-type ATPase [Halalkalibaculum roseum]
MNTDTLTDQRTACFHCGEDCREGTVYIDDKAFCCSGCKMVYEILDENELNTYYCLESQPGISFKKYTNSGRFDYLDDLQVIEKLTDFKNDNYRTVSFYIPNIHCTSCVWLLENLYKLDPGVTKSSVNFMKREISISFRDDETGLRSIVELLASIGYEPELRLEKLDGKKSPSPDRKLWLKMGVAGFAFGNIMLFSFPEYLSGSTLNNQGSFHTLFGILNILLAIPVLFYSAGDYLKSAWAAISQGGINLDVPISMGILALFSRSVYEISTGIGAGYMDSLTGLVFFLLIGRMIQKKTYERLSFDRDYKSYLPISVTVQDENGNERTQSIDRLEEGTTLIIRNRELVPADAELQSEKCFVDYSFITGESEPVEITEGETIYAGGKIIGPAATMQTVKKVSNSYLTKLWNDSAFDDSIQRPAVSSLADRISPHFTLAVLMIAITAGLLWWPVSVEMAITVFTAVLIIACPCALALSTPFTLGSALNIFSRNGLYIKGIEVIEKLAKASSIVFDKTGTLTEADNADVTFHGTPLTSHEKAMIKSAAQHSIHPLSQKIAAGLEEKDLGNVSHFEETVNKGISAEINGIQLRLGSQSFVASHLKEDTIPETAAGRAVSVVHIAIGGHWKGWFEIANSYRSGMEEMLDRFKERLSTYLISGDNDSQQKQFEPYFPAHALRFEQSPEQKLDFIRSLQEDGGNVIMIGDGLNDAGALRQSDFGIALTDNISAFTPACDAILDGNSLSKMNQFLDFSQASIRVIKLSFGLSLLYNIVGLSFAVAGQLSPLVAAILMPLSSISIMIFTTAGTHLAAKNTGLLTWK